MIRQVVHALAVSIGTQKGPHVDTQRGLVASGTVS